jgi:hypothetical protein
MIMKIIIIQTASHELSSLALRHIQKYRPQTNIAPAGHKEVNETPFGLGPAGWSYYPSFINPYLYGYPRFSYWGFLGYRYGYPMTKKQERRGGKCLMEEVAAVAGD